MRCYSLQSRLEGDAPLVDVPRPCSGSAPSTWPTKRYRIYAPRRINSWNKTASFAVRKVARDEASFASGLPVTTPERTIFDLGADGEDPSLVADALRNACAGSKPFASTS